MLDSNDPELAQVQYQIGNTYINLQDYQQALKFLTESLEI